MKILILGIEGMLGHALFHYFSSINKYAVSGTSRDRARCATWYPDSMLENIHDRVDARNPETIRQLLQSERPDVVVNCIGIIKQQSEANDPVSAIGINALLPHVIAGFCDETGTRLIHVSTDCVFSGKKGNYTEDDFADADDLYGRSKYLGEVKGENAVTLRTSIIGHELQGKLSLVEWFLSQNESVNGYVNAIYSGFPTIELARIIDEYVIPDAGLSGLYHVSSEPVSKYDLLSMIAEIYNKKIDILPYDKFTENKSLDSTRFRERTGYVPPDWRTLVEKMHKWYQRNISMYK